MYPEVALTKPALDGSDEVERLFCASAHRRAHNLRGKCGRTKKTMARISQHSTKNAGLLPLCTSHEQRGAKTIQVSRQTWDLTALGTAPNCEMQIASSSSISPSSTGTAFLCRLPSAASCPMPPPT